MEETGVSGENHIELRKRLESTSTLKLESYVYLRWQSSFLIYISSTPMDVIDIYILLYLKYIQLQRGKYIWIFFVLHQRAMFVEDKF